jgi:predicted nucleotide-binding protein (sugar kinase/HSP70/actin superfamily)
MDIERNTRQYNILPFVYMHLESILLGQDRGKLWSKIDKTHPYNVCIPHEHTHIHTFSLKKKNYKKHNCVYAWSAECI